MKRVIITGANGFLGSELIKRLIAEKIEVVALYRNSYSNIPDSTLVTKIIASLDDVEALEKYIPDGEYDALYHFAWSGVNGPTKANPIVQLKNAELAVNCATLCKKMGIKKLLVAGTIAEKSSESLANLEKTSGGMMYGVVKQATHLILEAYCKNIGQDFVWMQFSNIYGPTNKTGNLVSYTIGELIKGKEATFGPALQPYDFVYVGDLIEAVFRLGKDKTHKNCYFIGSGEPRLLKDYLLEIGSIYGRKDLVKIGNRPDDGIRYDFEMFDTSSLEADIGKYISMNFTNGIKYTMENY